MKETAHSSSYTKEIKMQNGSVIYPNIKLAVFSDYKQLCVWQYAGNMLTFLVSYFLTDFFYTVIT